MDKDSVILKYEELEIQDVEKKIDFIAEKNEKQEESLKSIQKKVKELYELKGVEPTSVVRNKIIKDSTKKISNAENIIKKISYDDHIVKKQGSPFPVFFAARMVCSQLWIRCRNIERKFSKIRCYP